MVLRQLTSQRGWQQLLLQSKYTVKHARYIVAFLKTLASLRISIIYTHHITTPIVPFTVYHPPYIYRALFFI